VNCHLLSRRGRYDLHLIPSASALAINPAMPGQLVAEAVEPKQICGVFRQNSPDVMAE
jgi:hypothetical protein